MDTLGLVWGVRVVAGRVSEAAGAKQLLGEAHGGLTRWERLWVDGGYEDRIEDWVAEHCGWQVEVVKRPDGKRGWVLLPKRWSRKARKRPPERSPAQRGTRYLSEIDPDRLS